jgi:hypothetical protein
MSLLGNIFRKAVDPSLNIEWCLREAAAGDAKAQYALGLFYERGKPPALLQDYAEAAKWYRKAAEQGHAGAQLYLGILLAQANGVERNFVEAYKWIALAKGGNALDKAAAVETQGRLVTLMMPAEISEGERLLREFVPTKGKDEELRLLQRATETANMVDQYNLATFYSQTRIPNGQGNNALVVKWMTLAAQQGFAPALVQLAAVHQFGGVPADSKKVFEWNYKAAEQGYSDAQVELSDIYSDICGTGVEKDLVQAYKWLKVAIDQGETSFDPSWACVPKESRVDMQYMVPRMKELVSVMTADQIAEGNRLAASFVPKRKLL